VEQAQLENAIFPPLNLKTTPILEASLVTSTKKAARSEATKQGIIGCDFMDELESISQIVADGEPHEIETKQDRQFIPVSETMAVESGQ